MKPGSTPKRKKWTSNRIALSLFLLFALGGFVLWWVAAITDRNMRSELLQQARIAAHAISIDDVASLSASESDLEKPSYHRIKSRLALMRRARHHCRFMYLMGRRADGTVFFFVDSLGPDDKDYAPPGLTYSEVSEDYLRVFESRQEAVVGPVTDRWGTLVTALIPLRSSASGNLRAVFGMDVDAGDWWQEIVRRCIGPLVATLLFAVLIFMTASREKTLRALRESEEKQAADITKLQQAEKELTRRSAFERLVGEISAEFVRLGPEEVGGGIERALATVGAHAGTDRAYVFLYRTDGLLADNTHEWCAHGIEPQIEHLQGISVGADLPWFEAAMMKGKILVVPDVATLPPEAQAERVHFEAQGIQSLMVVPMTVKDHLLGFMGFDAVREKWIWEKTDQDVLQLMGQVFTHALQRRRMVFQLQESEDRWRFALEGAGDGVWDWDAIANKVFFSAQWKAMLGYTEEEIGDSLDEWDRRLHPADKAAVYADLKAHLRGMHRSMKMSTGFDVRMGPINGYLIAGRSSHGPRTGSRNG